VGSKADIRSGVEKKGATLNWHQTLAHHVTELSQNAVIIKTEGFCVLLLYCCISSFHVRSHFRFFHVLYPILSSAALVMASLIFNQSVRQTWPCCRTECRSASFF